MRQQVIHFSHSGFCGSCLRPPPTCQSEMKVEQMVTLPTHGNEANHRHVIEGYPLLEILNLWGDWGSEGCAVDVTLVCPCLRDLHIDEMKNLETCKVVSPVLSDLFVEWCPLLDVSSMIQPSLQIVGVYNCNVSVMAMIFGFIHVSNSSHASMAKDPKTRTCLLYRVRYFSWHTHPPFWGYKGAKGY